MRISWIGSKYCYRSKCCSCVPSGGFTTKYFNHEKGARQGDLVSAYLFISALEIIFLLTKNDSSIKGIKVFDNFFLYTAYASDSTFFLKDLASLKKLLDIFSGNWVA